MKTGNGFIQTGNRIIQTGNGIISPTSSPPMKKLLLQNVSSFYQRVQMGSENIGNWIIKPVYAKLVVKAGNVIIQTGKELFVKSTKDELKIFSENISEKYTKVFNKNNIVEIGILNQDYWTPSILDYENHIFNLTSNINHEPYYFIDQTPLSIQNLVYHVSGSKNIDQNLTFYYEMINLFRLFLLVIKISGLK